ncbi:hypothetical protein BG004_003215, partial [Podila humilis]
SGALSAINDAVTLANWFSTLESPTTEQIEAVFKEYKAERHPAAKQAVALTQLWKSVSDKNMAGMLARSLFRRMPKWLMKRIQSKMVAVRPQLSFLPSVVDTGTVKAQPQPSLLKTLAIFKERQLASKAESIASDAAIAV